MKTYDSTPEFLEAYRRVTNSLDDRPQTIARAMRDDDTALAIYRNHAELCAADAPTPDFLEREIEKLKDAVREIQAALGFDHLIGEPETTDEQALKRLDEREQFNPDVPIF